MKKVEPIFLPQAENVEDLRKSVLLAMNRLAQRVRETGNTTAISTSTMPERQVTPTNGRILSTSTIPPGVVVEPGAAPLVSGDSTAAPYYVQKADGWQVGFEGAVVMPADISNVQTVGVYLHWIAGWDQDQPIYDSNYINIENIRPAAGGAPVAWKTQFTFPIEHDSQQVDVVYVCRNKLGQEGSRETAVTIRCTVTKPGTEGGGDTTYRRPKVTVRYVWNEAANKWQFYFDETVSKPIGDADYGGYHVHHKWDNQDLGLGYDWIPSNEFANEEGPFDLAVGWTGGCKVIFVPVSMATGEEKVAPPYAGCDYAYVVVSGTIQPDGPAPTSSTATVNYVQRSGKWYFYFSGTVVHPTDQDNYTGTRIALKWPHHVDYQFPVNIPPTQTSWMTDEYWLPDDFNYTATLYFVPLNANGEERLPYTDNPSATINVVGGLAVGRLNYVTTSELGTQTTDNLFRNPDFELGLTHWTVWGGVDLLETGGMSGPKRVRIHNINTAAWVAQMIPVRPGDVLICDAYVKADAGSNGTARIIFQYWNAANQLVQSDGSTSLAAASATAWTKLSGKSQVPATAVKVLLHVGCESAVTVGAWYIDDCFLRRGLPTNITEVYYDSTGALVFNQLPATKLVGTTVIGQFVYAGAINVNQLVAGTATFLGDVVLDGSWAAANLILKGGSITLTGGSVFIDNPGYAPLTIKGPLIGAGPSYSMATLQYNNLSLNNGSIVLTMLYGPKLVMTHPTTGAFVSISLESGAEMSQIPEVWTNKVRVTTSYAVGDSVGITGTRTVKDGAGANKIVTLKGGIITGWEV